MSAPPVSFYADFAGLASLRGEAKAQDPAALKEAAKQFESLFTQMLLKSMREANRSFGGDSLFGSEQADFYHDMFDDQMAVYLSQGKGLGLADMLIRQLQGGTLQPGEGRAVQPLEPGASTSTAPAAAAAGPQARTAVATSKEDFVSSLWPHAERVARELGVKPEALVAQAALETGWGRSIPCNAAGECSFNLFGIKAGSSWPGATVNVSTLEFEDGIASRRIERFRSYESVADSFRDYAALIRRNPRYENALGTGGDVAAFASALQEGGYATDPAYARKIVAVAREVQGLAQETFKSHASPPLTGRAGVRT